MVSTISPMATAQMTYTRGAAGPMSSVTEPGSRKMPPPTVVLKIAAARPQTPMARVSPRSAAAMDEVWGAALMMTLG